MSIPDVAADGPSTRLHGPSPRRTARGMCLLVAFGAVATQGLLAWAWISSDHASALVVARLGLADVPLSLDGWSRGLGLAVSMIPLAVLFRALRQVYQICDDIREGSVFWGLFAPRLRRIAWAMLALAAPRPLTDAALSVILTAGNPPGARHLVLAFSTDDTMIAILGGLIVVPGLVMREAGLIAQENQQII